MTKISEIMYKDLAFVWFSVSFESNLHCKKDYSAFFYLFSLYFMQAVCVCMCVCVYELFDIERDLGSLSLRKGRVSFS